jgi:glycosyltransferase involved in cell wall biosynthesis
MIVQDEEDCLLAALQSVQALTDELIMVDTGSTDRTPQLALTAGAKLFHRAWTNDFSVARNFALQQASSDWILVLDADEVLESIDSETFSALLTNDQVEGYFLRIRNILDSNQAESSDQVVRLFRNKPLYRFEGAIHEQAAPAILRVNNGNGLASAPLTIDHFGYLKERLHSKEKFTRNSEIIKQELQRNPDNPFLLYCLGLEYYQQDSISEGLNQLSKALGHMSGHEGYFEDVLLNLAHGYLRLEEITPLIDFLSKALSMYPAHADFLFLRGSAYFQQGNYPKAVEDLERSLKIGTLKLATSYQVSCLLGDVYHSSGNFQQAYATYLLALEASPSSSYPWQQLLRLIQKGCPIDDLIDYLWKHSLQTTDWPNHTAVQLSGLESSQTPLYELSSLHSSQSLLYEYAQKFLMLALKEIHLCYVILNTNDPEFTHLNLKNQIEKTFQDALLILRHYFIDSRETDRF